MKAEPEFYLSYWHVPTPFKSLVIRTTGDPRTVIVGVQKVLRAVDPRVAIEDVRTFGQIRSDSIAPRVFAMRLLIGFSIAASVLALVGIYGVLSLSVGSQRRAIAIRMAVGAQRRDILDLVIGAEFQLIAVGLILGVVVALSLARVLRTFLFGVEPSDPATLIGVALMFTTVALLACWLPARRATKIDPVEALRYE